MALAKTEGTGLRCCLMITGAPPLAREEVGFKSGVQERACVLAEQEVFSARDVGAFASSACGARFLVWEWPNAAQLPRRHTSKAQLWFALASSFKEPAPQSGGRRAVDDDAARMVFACS